MSAIIGLLSSLPELLSLAKSIWVWLNKVSGNDPAGFIKKANEAFVLLHKAETQQEMTDAAKAIQDLIHSGKH